MKDETFEVFTVVAKSCVTKRSDGNCDTSRYEAADVLYHLVVMLAARDVTVDEVLAELDRRAGMSGIAEKAARG